MVYNCCPRLGSYKQSPSWSFFHKWFSDGAFSGESWNEVREVGLKQHRCGFSWRQPGPWRGLEPERCQSCLAWGTTVPGFYTFGSVSQCLCPATGVGCCLPSLRHFQMGRLLPAESSFPEKCCSDTNSSQGRMGLQGVPAWLGASTNTVSWMEHHPTNIPNKPTGRVCITVSWRLSPGKARACTRNPQFGEISCIKCQDCDKV